MFMATMAVLAVTLGWLGWRLLQQDEQLETQRRADRREVSADIAVAGIEKRISSVEQDLASMLASKKPGATAPLAEGAVIVELRPDAVQAWPSGRLVYYPELPQPPLASDGMFSKADGLEFRQRDFAAAIAELRGPTTSDDMNLRGQALARIARIYLKSNQPQQALEAYGRLASLGATSVGGMPAALAGNIGALAVYERKNDRAGLEQTALALNQELQSGRWAITAATYEYVRSQISRWIKEPVHDADGRLGLAEAIDRFWHDHRSELGEANGRRSGATSSGPVLLIWRSSERATTIFASGASYLDARWLAPSGLHVGLIDPSGRKVAGDTAERGTGTAVRMSSVTGLPWTVQVFDVVNAADGQAIRARRLLFITGLGVLLVVIVAGAWFVGRSVTRELAVARLQADFVSAVSHEFRTPLTTLCQLSELLERGRVTSDEDKQKYYEFLRSESDRLRRLVDNLLNFGRLQAGRVEFHFEAVDPSALVHESASEFTRAQRTDKHLLVVEATPTPGPVQADRDALRLALWNLFENAVKYSPGHDTVRIDVTTDGPHVDIAVKDYGIGIPLAEQRQIFDKFARGSAAREHNISGTGIGLATAREIVRAHGGDLTVESEPGQGTTFRMRLPLEKPV